MNAPARIVRLRADAQVRMACEDNLDFMRRLDSRSVKLIVTSPPYNLGKAYERRDSLDVVQQLENAYFDRKLAIEFGWEFHPIATKIPNSYLTADFRKEFGGLHVQAEVQFGNMSRWYSDIFKFQAAYSESLTQAAISIVPTLSLATRIDSNIANVERCKRELPSANLSITLPILLVGVSIDEKTTIVNVSRSKFSSIKEITGKGTRPHHRPLSFAVNEKPPAPQRGEPTSSS